MKAHEWVRRISIATLASIAATAAGRDGADATPAVHRVGIYDSRIVAFAHFWSEPVRQQRDQLARRAKAAKEAGDTAASKKLEAQGAAGQKRIHLQAFSTAPADEAMLALADKLPALQRELGVERIVSKWDREALKKIPEIDRLDITDRLVREFLEPTEKQRKTIESMKTAKPLPLWQAKLLNAFGKW